MMKIRALIFCAALPLLTASLGWAQGFSALLSNFSVPLYDSCGSTDPDRELPDGLLVYIMHDMDLDGPDYWDPLVTICDEPPECPTGPTGTVNYNTFALNGQSWGASGGMFYADRAFASYGALPNPNRFYLRICVPSTYCDYHYIATQGHLNGSLSLTDFSPPSGPSEWEFDTWRCEQIIYYECWLFTPVTGFTASDNECDRVILTWNAYTDTVDVDSLFIQRGGTLIQALDRTATVAYDSTMDWGQPYQYGITARRVCGWNFYASSPIVTDSGIAIALAPVTGIAASDSLSQDYVLVEWNDLNNEQGYRVYRDGVTVMEVAADIVAAQISCTDFAVHGFQVRGFNDCGGGALSAADSGSCGVNSADESWIAGLPTTFALHQNYPNPFNPQTTIVFDVPHTAEVSLRIFNTAGQQIAVLQDGWLNTGRHMVQFNGQALPSGVYFGQLQSGEYAAQIKMLLLK